MGGILSSNLSTCDYGRIYPFFNIFEVKLGLKYETKLFIRKKTFMKYLDIFISNHSKFNKPIFFILY